jgi:hypothetical protein
MNSLKKILEEGQEINHWLRVSNGIDKLILLVHISNNELFF